MARRKFKQNRILLGWDWLIKRNRNGSSWLGTSLLKLLKTALILGFFTGVGIALYRLDKTYIKPAQSHETGQLVFKKMPTWVSDDLRYSLLEKAGGEKFILNENSASIIRENLKSVAWLDNIKVQTTNNEIQVWARYRIPIVLIKSGHSEFYVDVNQVVLDYFPMPNLSITEVKGVTLEPETPHYGEVWKRDDLSAALKIIDKIHQMDSALNLKNPLIGEISSIDVSNYKGRKKRSDPHIVLYSKDNTEIQWGAQLGDYKKEMESSDEQKLAKLYNYYKQYGTLSAGRVKYINLRDPKDKIPLP